jgi:hypothetical protein
VKTSACQNFTAISKFSEEVFRGNRSSRVLCSWRVASWANIELEGLHEVQPEGIVNGSNSISHSPTAPSENPKTAPDDSLLIYGYIPSVANPGVADAEYAVWISKEGASTPRVVEKTWRATTATVKLEGRS